MTENAIQLTMSTSSAERDKARLIKSAEAFLASAATESAALSDFCNAYAEMTHAAAEHKPSSLTMSSSSSPSPSGGGLGDDRSARTRRLHRAVSAHSDALEALRAARKKVLADHSRFVRQCKDDPGRRPLRGDVLSLSESISRHVGLSERAVRTCCSQGGLIHANGLLVSDAAGGEGDVSGHEMRLVMLSAVRASIAEVKREVEKLSG